MKVQRPIVGISRLHRSVPAKATPSTVRDNGESAAGEATAGRVPPYFLVDAVCILVALGLGYLLRFESLQMPSGYAGIVACAPLVWCAVFACFGLYDIRHLAPHDEFRRVIAASSTGVVLMIMVSFWSKASFSRAWIGLTWMLVVVLELAARKSLRWYEARMQAGGRLSTRTAIVGSNREAEALAAVLSSQPGYEVLGYVTTGDGGVVDHFPMLGRLEDLDRIIDRTAAQCLFVAGTAVNQSDLLRVSSAARRFGIDMRVSANLPALLTPRVSLHSIGDTMALSVKVPRLTGTQARIKRVFDVVVSIAALVPGLPLMAIIAAAIKLTSPGPVLFRQVRVTQHGRTFSTLKFRTMVMDSDKVLRERGIDPTAPFFKLEDDPRITRVGNLLRRTSLDELPQLFNVLAGDMSLVGPRPLPVEQVQANRELLEPRHEVKAGLTGWWQVNGRSDVSPAEAVRMDEFYIRNWSLSFDIYILLRTALAVLAGRGSR